MKKIATSWKDKNKRERIIELIDQLKRKDIKEIGSIEVPEGLKNFGTIIFKEENCIACAACARICPSDAIKIKKEYDLQSVIERWKKSEAINRKELAEVLEKIKGGGSIAKFEISNDVIGFGEIEILVDKCTFCLDCIKVCGFDALEPELKWDLKNILLKHSKS